MFIYNSNKISINKINIKGKKCEKNSHSSMNNIKANTPNKIKKKNIKFLKSLGFRLKKDIV